MALTSREHQVPGYRAERILDGVLRFRKSWSRYHRPDDVNHLLKLFPELSLARGLTLDYLLIGGGEAGWIWPYVRPAQKGLKAELPPELAAIPRDQLATQRGDEALKPLVTNTLYRYIEYERTAMGLFEYAFFINELWATKSAAKDAEWLKLQPLFTRWQFDAVLRKAGRALVRVARPDSYDPLVFLSPVGGGEVRFLVYHERGWKRIAYLHCLVDPEGSVERSEGELIANFN